MEEETGIDLALLDALRPFLGESLMVIDDQWQVKANLAPPGGLIGRGLGVGRHTLEDMHPDDLLPVLELSNQAYQSGERFHGSVLVRMRRGDDTYGRYEITATSMLEDPVIAGVVVRTRELVEAADVDVVDEIEPLLATLAELLPTGVLVLAADGHVLFANPAACSLLGRDLDALRADLAAAVHPEDRARFLDALGALGAAVGRRTVALRSAPPSGVELECTLASHGTGKVSVILAVLVDVTRQREVERELTHRAEHDALTGLRNRAAVLDTVRDRIAVGDDLLVAYVDLDGFKAVNDRYGHAVGDRALTVVAGALEAAVGDRGFVARLGGDEFVAVLDGGTTESVADELRGAVASLPLAAELGLGASVGLTRSRPDDTPRDLVHRADESMYADKRRRRAA